MDASEIAADAIVAFCIEDGKFNGFMVGLETVLQFLGETMTPPTDVQQLQLSLRDLKSILDAGGKYLLCVFEYTGPDKIEVLPVTAFEVDD